jgi:hypothetical protein
MTTEFNNSRRSNFLGHDGFVWWLGTIESRMDPLNVGRCQVRIKGLHDNTKTKVSTESLPWAQPLYPTNNSYSTPSTLREGDMVMGFFMDGDGAQFPIIMGAFHGIPEDTPDRETGFNDPRTDAELQSAPRKVKSITYKSDGTGVVIEETPQANNFPFRLNEPTTSRLSRNEGISETIVKTKLDSVVTVPDGTNNNWVEPKTPYNSKYPYNQVISTESGHYFELDDTPGSERTHLYHRSGTFSEIHPTGTQVDKVVKDKYTIVMKDDNVYIMGKCNITVQGDAKVYVKQNCTLTVDGDYIANIKGDYKLTVGKSMSTTVTNTLNQISSGATTIKGSTINLN